MATIASQFPGLFSYRELLNLDARDFQAWYTLAVKGTIRKIQANAYTNNLSMANGKEFQNAINAAVGLLTGIKPDETEEVAEEYTIEDHRRMMKKATKLFSSKGA